MDKYRFIVLEGSVKEAIAGLSEEAVGDAPAFTYVNPKKLWAANGQPGPSIYPFKGSLNDAAAFDDWIATHRFPGIWKVDDSNFWELTRANRSAVIVAVNPNVTNNDVEQALKNAAEKFPEMFYFGVIDGHAWADTLVELNVRTIDLPRVLVLEDSFSSWFEDIEELTVAKLDDGLSKILARPVGMMRQSRGVISKFWFWYREARYGLEGFMRYAGQDPQMASSWALVLIPLFLVFNLILWLLVTCLKALMDEPHAHVD